MNPYLTREELAEWLCCSPSSYRAMDRRLSAMGVPHISLPGFPPRVLRTVHDAMMRGERLASERPRRVEPNFDAIRDRRRKAQKP